MRLIAIELVDGRHFAMDTMTRFYEHLPRPGMRAVVDDGELRGGELRVALRGGEALVA